MRTIDEIESDLKINITVALVPLQTTRSVNLPALIRLVDLASEGATALKGQKQIPRSFINEIFVAERIIRRESQYNKNPQILDVA